MSSMDVIGTNSFIDSVSTRMSPGSLPNQPKSQGANCKAAPMNKRMVPSMMNHFAMSFSRGDWQGLELTCIVLSSL